MSSKPLSISLINSRLPRPYEVRDGKLHRGDGLAGYINDKFWPEIFDYAYPLGLMSLASYARENGFSNIDILDCNIKKNPLWVLDEAEKNQPDVIGLSGLTADNPFILLICHEVKKRCPNSLILCGGPAASSDPKYLLENAPIDLIVIGEGERTFVDVLEHIQNGKSLSGIKGTAFRGPSGVVKTAPREQIDDLDSLPMPAYDLVDVDFYSKTQGMAILGQSPHMAMFTSRACPYKCTYCHDIFGKDFRGHSAESVVAHIEYVINEFGIHNFEFYDDIWNLDRKRMRKICQLIIDKDLNIKMDFPNGLRWDLMSEEDIKLLSRAGGHQICVAVESMDKQIQKQIKKNNRIGRLKRNIAIGRREGLYICGFFMVGFPKESFSQMLKTCLYIIRSPFYIMWLFRVIPFEGTEIKEQTDKHHQIPESTSSTEPYFFSKQSFSEVPAWILNIATKITFMLFYFNPWRAFQLLRIFPSKRFFFTGFVKFARIIVG